jgi:hypothetical protein
VGLNFEAKSEMSSIVPPLSRSKHSLRVISLILDTIRDDELVTARTISTSVKAPDDSSVNKPPSSQSYPGPSKQQYATEPHEPSRIQIRLVTAALARVHARATLKDRNVAQHGIFAFDGEFISGNTSLVTIRLVGSLCSSDISFRMLSDVKPLVF